MLLQPFQTRQHRRVFFWLILFCAECVVAEWVQADRLWLFGVERFGDYGPVNLSAQSILCMVSKCYAFCLSLGWTYGLELCMAVTVTVDMAAVMLAVR